VPAVRRTYDGAATSARPIALTIAGSDPSGGAGVQGDLRAFAAFGVHGTSVVTCITAQGTRGVRRVVPLDASLVAAQLDALLDDVRVDAVKTGALATTAIVKTVASRLARVRAPLVIDPVLTSTSGAPLLEPRGVAVLVRALFPRAALVTPNVGEIARLLDRDPPRDVRALRDAAIELRRSTGARAVLAKGGHLDGDAIDVLVDARGVRVFASARVDTRCTHGTGCTLASAIAAGLAHGRSLRSSVRDAKDLVTHALQIARPLGPGRSPLDVLGAAGCDRSPRSPRVRANAPSSARTRASRR
jgi:hydroxymethylpyrimidine/phosphomethylpyrimidine kinase